MQFNHVTPFDFNQIGLCNNSHNYNYATINIQHDKRINNLIPENKVSNKSKNLAPGYEERISQLWFGHLERSSKILLNRAYAYITHIVGLTLVLVTVRCTDWLNPNLVKISN